MYSFLVDELLLYLRKSRSDNPLETVEEVLAKHEQIIQEFCKREYGFTIPEENIYREVVSGESIADRTEIKKVLSRMESKKIKGIVVIEPQRLSRGDLVDCGRLINSLQYTNTMVVTPTATYNMQNKMEKRFFQDELLRGRDYLEYTKEILMRGKLASVNRGCYLSPIAPYGYDKVKVGKDCTLTPNSDSVTVQMIFDMFAKGITSWAIAKELMKKGIKSPSGRDEWQSATIDKIIKNKHYIGKIVYLKDKTIVSVADGEKCTKRERQKEGDYIVTEGKHPPIIDIETFNKAQALMELRPPVHHNKVLRNAFAGIMYCANCGKIMLYKDKGGIRQYLFCKNVGCSKAIKYNVMMDTVIQALEQSELPNLVARYNNGEGDSAKIQKKRLKNLERELEEMKAQEETQYELLETKKYTQDLFDRRNKVLRDKMKATEEAIQECKRTMPDAVDLNERISSLKDAIESLKNPDIPATNKNILLKAIIERIEVKSIQNNKNGVYDFTLKIKLRI